MVTLALGGGKRGGKLLLLCPTIWDTFAVYLQQAMQDVGYKENTKVLTRAQVRTIVKFLGEP